MLKWKWLCTGGALCRSLIYAASHSHYAHTRNRLYGVYNDFVFCRQPSCVYVRQVCMWVLVNELRNLYLFSKWCDILAPSIIAGMWKCSAAIISFSPSTPPLSLPLSRLSPPHPDKYLCCEAAKAIFSLIWSDNNPQTKERPAKTKRKPTFYGSDPCILLA